MLQFTLYPLQQYVSVKLVMADRIFNDLYGWDEYWGCPLQRLLLCLKRNSLADGCSLTSSSDFEAGAMADFTIPAALNELICREKSLMPPALYDAHGVAVVNALHCACLHIQGHNPQSNRHLYYLIMPLIQIKTSDDLLWLTLQRNEHPFDLDDLFICHMAFHKALRLSSSTHFK